MASRGGGGGGGGHGKPLCRDSSSRSASFHGRSTTTAAASEDELPRLKMMRRPKTHPDLLGGVRLYSSSAPSNDDDDHDHDHDDERRRRRRMRVPAKVVVNVTVQRSLGPLQVMASTEWTVEKVVEEALKQYRKEGRRPLLMTTTVLDPSAFGLHYSQFSLQSLDPKENLIGLGSRNFFLCPKQPPPAASDAASAAAAAAPTSSSSSSSSSCSGEADKRSKITIPWLKFMDFLL